jgi:hypothetical protein
VEFEIDDNSNGEPVGNAIMGEISSSIVDKDIVDCSSLDPTDEQDLDDNMTQDSSGVDQIASAVQPVSVVRIDEPYLGQEFVSEAEAHAFYNAYATRVGFVIRVSKLSRSRRDGSVIGRALVCNKEGFRMPDKREKIVRQRAETRVGCRAMIMVRKLNSGLWSITKFVKEHTHDLTPGRGRRDFVYEQYPVSSCSFNIDRWYLSIYGYIYHVHSYFMLNGLDYYSHRAINRLSGPSMEFEFRTRCCIFIIKSKNNKRK